MTHVSLVPVLANSHLTLAIFLVVVYDTVNGIGPGFDGFLPVPNFLPLNIVGVLTVAQVTLYNPFVNLGDAGDYYCNYITGASVAQNGVDSYASSPVFSLTVNSLHRSKASRNAINWNYPILISSASKILF